MANYRTEAEKKEFRRKVLYAAAKLFLEQGYTQTSVREIAKYAEVNVSTMNQFFG
ncbi:MAG: helix-turn-helix transcriptional regulator, partial [Firmicutes bacterium]|nr:helix-turn-helix transcriptional regulator [Bacillota bacterium]